MDLKELIKTFSRHEKVAEKARQKEIRDFLKNYPGEKIPGYLKDDFSIAAALKLMCEEIAQLKAGFK